MFDTLTNEGVLVSDADRAEFVLAPGALDGSIFRMLRQGQRVNFDLDADGRAIVFPPSCGSDALKLLRENRPSGMESIPAARARSEEWQ